MRTKDNDHLPKYYTNQTIRKKIDKLLSEIASINATLGTDSTAKEIQKATREIVKLEREIKKIDEEFYKEITVE